METASGWAVRVQHSQEDGQEAPAQGLVLGPAAPCAPSAG